MLHKDIITSSHFIYLLLIPCLLLRHQSFVETTGDQNAAGGSGKQAGEGGGQRGDEQSPARAGQNREHHLDPELLESVVGQRLAQSHASTAATGQSGRAIQIAEAEHSGMFHFPANVAARHLHSAGPSEGQISLGNHHKRKLSESREKIHSKIDEIKKAKLVLEKAKLDLTDMYNEHQKLEAMSGGQLEMHEGSGQQQLHQNYPQHQGYHQQIYSQMHQNVGGQAGLQPLAAHSQQIHPRQLPQQHSPMVIQQPHDPSFTHLLLQSGTMPPSMVQPAYPAYTLLSQQGMINHNRALLNLLPQGMAPPPLPSNILQDYQQPSQYQALTRFPFLIHSNTSAHQPPLYQYQQGQQWMTSQPQVQLNPPIQPQILPPQQQFHFQPNINSHLLQIQQPQQWMMHAVNHAVQFLSNQQAISQELIHQPIAHARNSAHLLEGNDENSANVVENTNENASSKGKGIMSASQSSVDASGGGMRTTKLMRDAMTSGHYPHSTHYNSPVSKSSSSNLSLHLSPPVQKQTMMEAGVKQILIIYIRNYLNVEEFWVNLKKANDNKPVGTCTTQKMAKFELLPEHGIKEDDVLTVTVSIKKLAQGNKTIAKEFRFSAREPYVLFPFMDNMEITLYDTFLTDQQIDEAVKAQQQIANQPQQAQYHYLGNYSSDAQEQDDNVDEIWNLIQNFKEQ